MFLPLHGAHQAQNAACALAAVEAFFGAGAATGPIDVDIVRAAFADGALAGTARDRALRRRRSCVDAAHNPHGMAATVAAIGEAFDFRRLVAVVAMLGDKDARGMLEQLEPIVDEIVVTQNSSARAMPADDLAALAVDVFGADRVTRRSRGSTTRSRPRCGWPRTPATTCSSAAGVLVTGSVVTAGEARMLLGAGP